MHRCHFKEAYMLMIFVSLSRAICYAGWSCKSNVFLQKARPCPAAEYLVRCWLATPRNKIKRKQLPTSYNVQHIERVDLRRKMQSFFYEAVSTVGRDWPAVKGWWLNQLHAIVCKNTMLKLDLNLTPAILGAYQRVREESSNRLTVPHVFGLWRH